MSKVTMVDPPNGWKYGFPKAVPEEIMQLDESKFREWIIAEGYPEVMVGKGMLEYCRWWIEDTTKNEREWDRAYAEAYGYNSWYVNKYKD